MAFWTEKILKEPLRQNRWFIDFGTYLSSSVQNADSFVYALKECSKPSYDIDVNEYKLLGQPIKFPGNLKWKPIDIKFVSAADDKGNYLPNLIHQYILQLGYQPPKDGKLQQIQKDCGKSFDLKQIDENGQTLETWKVNNPMITNVNYGTLSYENEGFVDVSLTIQYDWAELVKESTSRTKDVSPGFPI